MIRIVAVEFLNIIILVFVIIKSLLKKIDGVP
jgi:hypothetical protein